MLMVGAVSVDRMPCTGVRSIGSASHSDPQLLLLRRCLGRRVLQGLESDPFSGAALRVHSGFVDCRCINAKK
jgi:hypothetical protein